VQQKKNRWKNSAHASDSTFDYWRYVYLIIIIIIIIITIIIIFYFILL